MSGDRSLLLVEGQRAFLDALDSPCLGRFIGIRPAWGLPSAEYVEWLSQRPWGADNGAFAGFEPLKFTMFLDRLEGAANCLFVVAPDAVADMATTLAKFDLWEPTIKTHRLPVALALQDGLTRLDALPWGDLDAVFVGGTTRFKHSRIVAEAVAEAKRRGKWVHVGRVNENRRIRYIKALGADSFDGSGFSQNVKHIKRAIRLLEDTGQLLLATPPQKGAIAEA